jgi:hypothetical protein
VTRPPRPEPQPPLRDALVVRDGHLDHFPLDFGDLVDLAERIGGDLPPGDRDPTATLYQLSALVAHVLGVHQDHIAGEAFLGTATTARSLVKHGRRLGYEPAAGSTATGYLHVEAKKVSGELPPGVRVASSPSGGEPAQDFETRAARWIDPAWNRLDVLLGARDAAVNVTASQTELRLIGTGHGLRPGEPTILVGPGGWLPIEVDRVAEDRGETVLYLRDPLGQDLGPLPPGGYRVMSGPGLDLYLFGRDADPAVHPPAELEEATDYQPPPEHPAEADVPRFGYTASGADTSTERTEIFLSTAIPDLVEGEYLLALTGDGPAVGRIAVGPDAPLDVAVSFVRCDRRQQVTGVTVTDTETGQTITPEYEYVRDERRIAATVTRLRVDRRIGGASNRFTRGALGAHATLLARWRVSVPLVAVGPSSSEIDPGDDLPVEGAHPRLEPGMLVALSTRDRRRAQVVELIEVAVGIGQTVLRYKERTERPRGPDGSPYPWQLGDLIVLGNVVPIVHGASREEILGDSDGTTPFQRYKLKKAPLAWLPGGQGVTPDLEVRVGGVRWDRVEDFADSAPTARHYKLERDHERTVWIRFGDGIRGAVPASGRGNLSARYRVGLGPAGNLAAGRVSRLMKDHPLVDRIANPVPTAGGTAPAEPEDVRRQATLFIRTFDRAVSVRDHADLALLFPGVARATARYHDGAIELVAAGADGAAAPNGDLLLDFIDARRDASLPLRRVAPAAVAIALRVYVEFEPAWLPRDVEAAIRAALHGGAPGMFTFAARDLGQAAHASEVYQRITSVAGVAFCQLVRFDLAPGDPVVRDLIQPQPHQWLRLDAGDLSFAPAKEGDDD